MDAYRLLSQLGAGRDGVAYLAETGDDGEAVEVRVVSNARERGNRWPELCKRLTVASRLRHPAALRVTELELGHNPPFVVVELDRRPTMADRLGRDSTLSTLSTSAALRIGKTLAEAITAAHRIGLTHGALGPRAVRGEHANSVRLDFTGLEISPGHDLPGPDLFSAPEEAPGIEPGPAADVYRLGALTRWMLTGEPLWTSLPMPDPVGLFLDNLTASDPDARPTASGAVIWFGELLDALSEDSGSVSVSVEKNWGFSMPSGVANPTSDGVGPSNSGTIEVLPPPSPAPFPAIRLAGGSDSEQSGHSPDIAPSQPPERLGRFRLLTKLGEGGMGEVYKAVDEADGTLVAVKILRRELSSRPSALQRFRKEARLLAQVRNAYVTNLLEVNEDGGVHYIVLEFVDGRSLDRDLSERGRFDELTALAIAADVARGLSDAHRLGIVHRDIKPANILLVGTLPEPQVSRTLPTRTASGSKPGSGSRSGSRNRSLPRVKLSDFGLARHADQAETQAITRAGVVVGTPTYMAPEQCSGGAVDARTDVYALGVTLFHLVAGRPPFLADDWRAVVAKHQNEPPPDLRKQTPGASEGLCRVVGKALAKSPASRYADASAMLSDLERLLRGEPTGLPMHPVLPSGNPKDVLSYDFEWSLDASPRQLWPHVADTDRLDRAIGFGAVHYTLKFDPVRGVRRFLEGRKSGMAEEGEEHPYEWIEGRRLGVFREYARGPFYWVVSVVELNPRPGGGTNLVHRLRLVPRGRLVRLGANWGVGGGMRKSLEKVYTRIDAVLTGKLGNATSLDPFEPPPDLDDVYRHRLDERLGLLASRGVSPAVVDAFGDYLTNAPDPDLARIRPIVLARRFGLPEDQVVSACLQGANVGLLVLLWDLLCPVCRIPSEVKETLRDLASHGHCEACHLDYELDFANSVEMVFRADPQVRQADTKTYCAAGPAHSPHVVAQVRVQAGERFELDVDLTTGSYKIVGPQLGWAFDFRVRPGVLPKRWSLSLASGPTDEIPPALGPGGQVLELHNDSDRELLIRVEREVPRDDALTAARASALAVFRELFPAEVLAPGRLVSVSNVTLLLTGLDGATSLYQELGDARAFAALHEQFRAIDSVVRREGGAVVKSVGEGVLAAFPDPAAAVRAGLVLPDALAAGTSTGGLRVRAAAHRGPAMAATLNDQLDYFGTTVHQTGLALEHARGGVFVLSPTVASDPDVAAMISALAVEAVVIDGGDSGLSFGPLVGLPLAAEKRPVHASSPGGAAGALGTRSPVSSGV